MEIELAYGKTGLTIELPDELDVTVVAPRYVPAVEDERVALLEALADPIDSPPLRDLVKPTDRVGIVFSDITRPTPNHLVVPAVIHALNHVPAHHITLFNALGTHRTNTEEELRSMLGDDIVECYRIVQNNAFDPSSQVYLGVSKYNHEIWVNREFYECDVKILTGFIEPHFFAGFSGGGKAVLPGMAGQRTVFGNHDAAMIAHPNATWGVVEHNPIQEEIREAAGKVNPTFLINVALNREKRIVGVFAGNLDSAYTMGYHFVKERAMVAVKQSFDIVITSNSGYPLDLNLYQSVKGMSAAAQIVRPGGAIIIAASCWDGIPEHGLYGELLRACDSPQAVLEMVSQPGFLKQDQWQVQVQAQIQLKADVYLYTDNLSDEQIYAALLKPSHRIEDTVMELLKRMGRDVRICVLPEGPQTIPYVRS
ncbi:MAG: nickel-dependent lactate racemase [Anaerolineae bacterium]